MYFYIRSALTYPLAILTIMTPSGCEDRSINQLRLTEWSSHTEKAIPTGGLFFQTHPRYPTYGVVNVRVDKKPSSLSQELNMLSDEISKIRGLYMDAYRSKQLTYLDSLADGRSVSKPLNLEFVLMILIGWDDPTRSKEAGSVGYIVPASMVFGDSIDEESIGKVAFRSEDTGNWEEPSASSNTKQWSRDFRYGIIESHQAVREKNSQ